VPQPLDELCSPPTIAALLGVSPPTVYTAIRRSREDGLCHLRTPGNQIKVRRRDVLAYCHRRGLRVPKGLVPPRPRVVVLHPDHSPSELVRMVLEPRCDVDVYNDPIDGLIALGGLRPPLVVVSSRCGRRFIERLCGAVDGVAGVGYMAVVLLVQEIPPSWERGPVPFPVNHPEPRDVTSSTLGQLVERLLGLK